MGASYNRRVARVQTALRAVFPPSCVGCRAQVTEEDSLCLTCWRDLALIGGPVCQACGLSVLAEPGDDAALCQDCTDTPRPWGKGRAAVQYTGLARNLILGLKHSDRHDVAPVAALWLAQAAKPLLSERTLIVPVPLHWTRLVKRRYNQSALLAKHLALKTDQIAVLDLLLRVKRTAPMQGASVKERTARMADAISVNGKRAARLQGADVLLIDDVMTTGATFAACTEACLAGGARRVDVLALARVGKDD